jgi:hypothetical protein
MPCTTFNVGTSFNLQHGFSKPLGFKNNFTFHKSSTHLLNTFNLSFTDHTRSSSFQTVLQCVAQSSEPSASVGVDTNNNSSKHCISKIF